jgi:signal transduction histidine kinase
MAGGGAGLDAAVDPRRWGEWLLARNRRAARALLWIHLALYPTFGLLDLALAPRSALPVLLGIRVVVTVTALAMFRVVRGRWYERRAPWITSCFIVLGATGISLMTVFMGGLSSPYYAGLTLYIVAIGLLFVWDGRVVIPTYVAIVGSFVVSNLVAGTVGTATEAGSNLAFLCSTALVAGIGQVMHFRAQREQHDQRVRLEQTTANLEHAHAELQRLDQFKSRFFANMTHELRTPLAMVLTPLELILQGEHGELTDGQRTTFQSMFRNALKLLKLINDLLDLSRLEESRLVLQPGRHDLAAFLGALVEQTQVLARRKDIGLSFAASPPVAPLVCDLERLERVFVNLLSNAVKFTPPGGHVGVELRELGGGWEVVVRDDGPGFPPDMAERIFERFYQVDMGGTRQHGGAGIGLALARELVALHGGRIFAASDGRSGATFTVQLPHRGGPPTPSPVGFPDAGPGADLGVELTSRRDFRLIDIEEVAERRAVERDPDEEERPYTVLVVEDHPQVTRLVHQALRRHFKVLTAPDGAKGLELAFRERPSLVVTDLMMPGMDGFELTRRLREDPRTKHIPVLMLTARGALDDRLQGIETGVSAYLTKPFSPRELLSSARSLVRAKEETADLVLTERMESVELVTAGLAHEINNPLNYVKNALARIRLDAERAVALAGAARGRALDAEEQGQLERAARRLPEMLALSEAGLRRIAGTVELMRRYGRAGYRRELVLHDAWEAARSVVDVVLPATGRKVEVALDLQGDGSLECVPDELHQLLTNLVQNAVEAAPEEGGTLRLRGRQEGAMIVLSVKDNGPGVPPDLRSRLFTPFFTTKGPGRGMGLGLTIVRRVVQSLGGTIQVQGGPGEGAEFVVRVPRRQRTVSEAAVAR